VKITTSEALDNLKKRGLTETQVIDLLSNVEWNTAFKLPF